MKKKGFTLIEILVVVGSIILIMASLSGIMFGVFTSKSKSQAIDKINQSGSWISDELKKNILNAKSNDINGGDYFSCPMDVDGGNSITITNIKDGNKTTISCLNGSDGYKVASISARETTYLFQKNNDLFLNDCSNFVTCSTLPSLQLSEVKFNFNLGARVFGVSSGIGKSFSIDVTLRN